MISEQALLEAIAECQGQRNPNRDTCMMLAAFYTIKDHLYPGESRPEPSYSFAPAEQVRYSSGSDFAKAIDGKNLSEILPVLDEMMDAVKALLPRLYNAIMRKLSE